MSIFQIPQSQVESVLQSALLSIMATDFEVQYTFKDSTQSSRTKKITRYPTDLASK